MDAFSYQKPTSRDNRKLILLLLAGASFGVWYFDLVPQLSPVSTGTLEADITDPDLDQNDLMAMLDASERSAMDDVSVDELLAASTDFEDPLLSALTSPEQRLEDTFPEFGGLSEPAAASDSSNQNSIQQVEFEDSMPADVQFTTPPAVLPAELAEQLHLVDEWMSRQEILEAHAALSRLYWKQPEHRSHLYDRMQKTAAEIYANPNAHFAEPRVVEFGDSLDSIAREYEVPWSYLAQLNDVTPQTLQAGRTLKVLKGPFSAVVDLKRFELTIHAHGWYVHHYPIGLGNDGGAPVGNFTVQTKQENPAWHNPSGGVIESDDPTNPLGEYWIGLGNRIGIHGTTDPTVLGKTTSQGCIHLSEDDIVEVFHLLDSGSDVVIRDR